MNSSDFKTANYYDIGYQYRHKCFDFEFTSLLICQILRVIILVVFHYDIVGTLCLFNISIMTQRMVRAIKSFSLCHSNTI